MPKTPFIHISSKVSQIDKLPGAWRVVALLFFVGVLNYLDRNTITTLHESITGSIPMSEAQFGLLTSVFLWVYGLFSPLAGYIADKYGKSKTIIYSLIIWSIVTLITGYCKTFNQLLITRALMGLSEALYIPAALALIMDYHRGSTRSLANGINMAGTTLGSTLGFVGAWIAELHSWNMAFHILGLIGIVYAVFLPFFLHDTDRGEKTEKGSGSLEKQVLKPTFFVNVKNLFRKRSFLLMFIAWGLLGAVGWVIIGWLPTYYMEEFGLSQKVAGIYGTAYIYPGSIFGMLLGGFLADQWSKRNARGRIFVASLGLLIGAIHIFIVGSTPILWIVVVAFILYSIARPFADANMMPILSLFEKPNNRATAYGILNFSATIIGGLGIYATGILKDLKIDFNWVFIGAAFFLLICSILLYMIRIQNGKVD